MRRMRVPGALTLLLILSAGVVVLCDTRRETVERVAELLHLQAGQTLADIGAGEGEWTVPLARLVGDQGRVLATEVSDGEMKKLRKAIEKAGLRNVTTLMGDQDSTGLDPECCEAIHLRFVYHHFKNPSAMQASMLAALKPGGLIAVIEFKPENDLPLDSVPQQRKGHGIHPETVIEEMTAGGFEFVRRVDDWQDRSDRYLLLFGRPAS